MVFSRVTQGTCTVIGARELLLTSNIACARAILLLFYQAQSYNHASPPMWISIFYLFTGALC